MFCAASLDIVHFADLPTNLFYFQPSERNKSLIRDLISKISNCFP